MSLLRVEGLTRHYALRGGRTVRAVDGVDLEIRAGETLALVGESGCGKSTLARLVLRLETPTDGHIVFDGESTADLRGARLRRFRSRVQAVFQDPYSSLNPRLRVSTILAEPLRAHGVARAEIRGRLAAALDRVGLPSDAGRRYPHEFSGGQRQRIAIARALILEPELVVLDEPISALDVSIRAQILNLLSDLQADQGLAYLLIAHDLALVEHASRRVAVMYLGRIVESGPTAEIFAEPKHPYTQALLAAVPCPDPERSRAPLAHGEIASAVEVPSGCAFHPRCPVAEPECRSRVPEILALESREVACHVVAQAEAAASPDL